MVLNPTPQASVSEDQAIAFGRVFFQIRGVKIGQVLSVSIDEKQPNTYWRIHWRWLPAYVDYSTSRMCWVIQYEQAARPGHFVEIWIDSDSPLNLGGILCLGGISCK